MKIDVIGFKNFKGIKDQELVLDGKSTILFGVNGVGKSSVLEAINILFAPIINKIASNIFKQVDSLDIDDIKFGESIAKLSMVCHLGDSGLNRHEFTYNRTIERRIGRRTHDKNGLDSISANFVRRFISEKITGNEESGSTVVESSANMPIYANYGAHRAVHVVQIQRIHNKHTFKKISAFEKAIENVIDFRTFFEWFRNQQEYENHVKVNDDSNYVDLQLNCVKKAIITMLDKEIFTDIKIMFSPLRMVATKHGENLKIEQLSDGEKCTLAMIGDLARRLALANPSLDNPLEGEGIVLIDEVELHLHPTWQARIVPTLMHIFPNIQFIITTHSPKVLGEIGGDINILELRNGENGIQINKIPPLIGWDSNYILKQYMGTDPLNLDTKGKIEKMFELIEENNYEEATLFADELERLTSNLNTDVVKARILIARGRFGV